MGLSMQRLDMFSLYSIDGHLVLCCGNYLLLVGDFI